MTGSNPFPPVDVWSSGAAYEPYAGRWSRLLARAFLPWLKPWPGNRWLDVGCGTGALSAVILDMVPRAEIIGVDPSPSYVAYARQLLADPRVRVEAGDAGSLPLVTNSFDAAVSGLVLTYVPDPERAVAEMSRVVRSGGTVASYIWDATGGMELASRFWKAAADLDPAATALGAIEANPLGNQASLQRLFQDARLIGVTARAIEIPLNFADFHDLWGSFVGGQEVAPNYVASLDDAARSRLRAHLLESIPHHDDGSITLFARAWAVRGMKG